MTRLKRPPGVEEQAKVTPTLQVPTLVDGDVKLWDSTVIIDYLMSRYPSPQPPSGQLPFAREYVRREHEWHDKLVLGTLQTLGVSTATVSQLQWSGVMHEDNGFAGRCATRVDHLLDWLEGQLVSADDGFVPGLVSAQDVFLVCWCQFIDSRPLRLSWRAEHRPKIAALVERLEQRQSFQREPALWWEPGVTYATPEEVAWAAQKTNESGPTFDQWRSTARPTSW